MDVRRIAIALAFALLAPCAAVGQYAFRMLAVVNSAAHVQITRSGAFRQGYRDYECISFANIAQKRATRVVFDFLYFDHEKHFIGHDLLDRRGSFDYAIEDKAPFEKLGDPRLVAYGEHFNLDDFKDCLRFSFPQTGIAFDVVSVKRVDYEDGTSWESPPDATPAPTATP